MSTKNKISDLRNHLFEQLERLNDESLDKEGLEKEIWRSEAMTNVAGKIIESAKVEVDFIRVAGKAEMTSNIFDTTKALTNEGPK